MLIFFRVGEKNVTLHCLGLARPSSQLELSSSPRLNAPIPGSHWERGMGRAANISENEQGPLLAEQGLGELGTLPFALCSASPSNDIWEQCVVFAQPRGVLDSEEWSPWGRRGWQAL